MKAATHFGVMSPPCPFDAYTLSLVMIGAPNQIAYFRAKIIITRTGLFSWFFVV